MLSMGKVTIRYVSPYEGRLTQLRVNVQTLGINSNSGNPPFYPALLTDQPIIIGFREQAFEDKNPGSQGRKKSGFLLINGPKLRSYAHISFLRLWDTKLIIIIMSLKFFQSRMQNLRFLLSHNFENYSN